VRGLICNLASLYLLLVFVRVLFSWIPITPGTPVASIYSVLYSLTEPVLGPIRRAVPPARMGAMAIDLSPIIVLIGGQILLTNFVC
jgi:YggT family protein